MWPSCRRLVSRGAKDAPVLTIAIYIMPLPISWSISITAAWSAQTSSAVPLENPTLRLPCPAVVSRQTDADREVKSFV